MTETTAQRVPSLCTVRSRPRRSHSIHRWRSHAALGQNTEDSCCSLTALGNFAVSTAHPASNVALSDHNDAVDAAFATAIPLRELRVGDTFQDRRQPGHQSAVPGGAAADQQPPRSSRRVPPGDLLDDRPLPDCAILDIALTERDKQLITELRRASAMALPPCVVSRYATAWAESLEGAMSGHQSWALLCRYRCRLLLAKIPKGVDRNSELKQRLHLWETGQISDLICKVLGQQNSGPLRRTAGAVTDRRTARDTRIHQQSHEGTGGRRCAGLLIAGTGLHLSPHGARALEPVLPVRSAPRLLGLLGAVEGTNWHEVR